MIISITHRTDFDGIASGALILRYHMLYEQDLVISFLKDYSDELEIVEKVLFGLRPRKLYIADLSTSFKNFDEVLNRIKKVEPASIFWFDHHPTDSLQILQRAGISYDIRVGASATAAIIFERLYKGVDDRIASLITKIAIEADKWKFESPETRDVVDLVAYYNYLDGQNPLTPHLKSYMYYLASLKEPRMLGEWHIAHIKLYRRKVEEGGKLIEKTAITFEISGLKAAIAYSPSLISSSRAADMLLDKTGAKIAIIVKEEGTGSVRRRNTKADVSRIAKIFGGGGHPYAAGMKLRDEKITVEEYPKVAKWVRERISGLKLEE